MSENVLSAKEVARELGTDARTLRKFFRSDASPVDSVGQGARYNIRHKDLKKIKKAFTAWQGKKPKVEDKPDPEDMTGVGKIDFVEELDLDEDAEAGLGEEPTDDEIADLEEYLDMAEEEDF